VDADADEDLFGHGAVPLLSVRSVRASGIVGHGMVMTLGWRSGSGGEGAAAAGGPQWTRGRRDPDTGRLRGRRLFCAWVLAVTGAAGRGPCRRSWPRDRGERPDVTRFIDLSRRDLVRFDAQQQRRRHHRWGCLDPRERPERQQRRPHGPCRRRDPEHRRHHHLRRGASAYAPGRPVSRAGRTSWVQRRQGRARALPCSCAANVAGARWSGAAGCPRFRAMRDGHRRGLG
jgi:hypothetical protein